MLKLHACLAPTIVATMSLGAGWSLAAEPETEPTCEALVKILESDAPQKAKADACRLLQCVATKAAVPTLARLLTDEQLGHMARYALEPLDDPSVNEAFRQALGRTKGRLLAGVVGSLGVRRDAQAVEAVANLLKESDPIVVQAAARALGSIGTVDAGKALTAAFPRAEAGNQAAFFEGLLRCAENLSGGPSRVQSVAIYDSLRNMKDVPHQVRAGAIRGAILGWQKEGLKILKDYLQDKDYGTFAAACRTSQEMDGAPVTAILTEALPRLPAENQVLLVQTLGFRGDAGAVPTLTAAAQHGAKAVRLAAIRALAEIRDEASRSVLKELTTDTDADLATAAKQGAASFEPVPPIPAS